MNTVPTAINGMTLQRLITIADPQGLHMRPASLFAKRAREFHCNVQVVYGDKTVNGKSQLDLMLLAAEPGAELIVEVSGDDAATALPQLCDILAAEHPPEEVNNDLSAFD